MRYYIVKRNRELLYEGKDFQEVQKLLPPEFQDAEVYSVSEILVFNGTVRITHTEPATTSKIAPNEMVSGRTAIITMPKGTLEQLLRATDSNSV